MRVAALYDVHGNLPALEAVLAEVEREQVDAIVLGGDCIHGPQPRETLSRLQALGDRARQRVVDQLVEALLDEGRPHGANGMAGV